MNAAFHTFRNAFFLAPILCALAIFSFPSFAFSQEEGGTSILESLPLLPEIQREEPMPPLELDDILLSGSVSDEDNSALGRLRWEIRDETVPVLIPAIPIVEAYVAVYLEEVSKLTGVAFELVKAHADQVDENYARAIRFLMQMPDSLPYSGHPSLSSMGVVCFNEDDIERVCASDRINFSPAQTSACDMWHENRPIMTTCLQHGGDFAVDRDQRSYLRDLYCEFRVEAVQVGVTPRCDYSNITSALVSSVHQPDRLALASAFQIGHGLEESIVSGVMQVSPEGAKVENFDCHLHNRTAKVLMETTRETLKEWLDLQTAENPEMLPWLSSIYNTDVSHYSYNSLGHIHRCLLQSLGFPAMTEEAWLTLELANRDCWIGSFGARDPEDFDCIIGEREASMIRQRYGSGE